MDVPQFAISSQKPGASTAGDTPRSSLFKDFGVCSTRNQLGPASFSVGFACQRQQEDLMITEWI